MDAQTLQATVTYVALVLGSLSFIVFVVLALALRKGADPAPAALAQNAIRLNLAAPQAVTPAEFTDILKAITALGEALSKAGPSLTALIGSVLFLAIAAVSSGAIRDVDRHESTPKTSTDNAPGKDGGAATPSDPKT